MRLYVAVCAYLKTFDLEPDRNMLQRSPYWNIWTDSQLSVYELLSACSWIAFLYWYICSQVLQDMYLDMNQTLQDHYHYRDNYVQSHLNQSEHQFQIYHSQVQLW